MDGLKGITNIVSVEDYALDANEENLQWTIFIRMELLTSFPEYQRSHSLTEADVLRLGLDICTALHFCEKTGIIHRDIKPSNIFLSPLGHYKLGDFGVARTLDKTSGALSAKGTFLYMSPEMAKGLAYDHRTDLYSLGLVLYRLLNRNRDPFVDLEKQIVNQRDREKALTQRISGEALPPPAEATPQSAAVILKACAYRPEDRYQNAAAFADALKAATHKAPVSSPKPSEKETNNKKPNKKKPRGCLFSLIVMLAAGFFAWGQGGRELFFDAYSQMSQTAQRVMKPEDAGLIVVQVPKTAAGITFLGNQARHWVNPAQMLDTLKKSGCLLDAEETRIFERTFLAQFKFAGKAQDLKPGNRVTLAYAPDDAFTGLLKAKGYALRLNNLTRQMP